MVCWPSCSFSFSIARATFDSPIKHSSERAKEVLRLRPLLSQLLLCGEICCCRWCLTKEQRVVLLGLTKNWWFHFRATSKVSEFVFILCWNESKSSWKCSSVSLKNQTSHTPAQNIGFEGSFEVANVGKVKKRCTFACGSYEGRKEMIPGIGFTTLNLCLIFIHHWSEKAVLSLCLSPPVSLSGKNPCSPHKNLVWKLNTPRYHFT